MAPPPQLELALGRVASSVSMDRGRPLPCPFRFCHSCSQRGVPFACERADPPLLHCLLLRILLLVADTGIRCCLLHLQARSNTPERFTKVLLGANMSGSGKGICTMLAITNLSGTHERGHPGMPQAWLGSERKHSKNPDGGKTDSSISFRSSF